MANSAQFITESQPLTNQSGGALAQGDVVIVDTAHAAAVTTTTTGAYTATRIGVVVEPNGIAAGAVGKIGFAGYVPVINLNASASNGDLVKTHTVAKQGTPHSGIATGDFAEVLGTGTTPSALLFGGPSQAGGGSDATAIHVSTGGEIAGITEKTAPVGADLFVIEDSAASNAKKKLQLLNSGAKVLISSQTPTATGTVTFSSIPATYRHLILEYVGRTDKVATTSGGNLRFNNDTTDANYERESLTADGSVTSGKAANADVCNFQAASSTANYATYTQIWIPFYALTTFNKKAEVRNIMSSASTTISHNIQVMSWHNTAAINRIDIITDDSSNYVTGTTFNLYGTQ